MDSDEAAEHRMRTNGSEGTHHRGLTRNGLSANLRSARWTVIFKLAYPMTARNYGLTSADTRRQAAMEVALPRTGQMRRFPNIHTATRWHQVRRFGGNGPAELWRLDIRTISSGVHRYPPAGIPLYGADVRRRHFCVSHSMTALRGGAVIDGVANPPWLG
ncbi:hypothetical protein GCM10027186_07850 [Micromonospora schwarzwaldensis]